MTLSLPRLFLLENRFLSAEAARKAVYQSSTHLILDEIVDKNMFLTSLQAHRPSLVLLGEDGTRDAAADEFLEICKVQLPPLAVLVLGESDSEQNVRSLLQSGAIAYLNNSHFDQLPQLLEEIVREHDDTDSEVQLRYEVRRAADAMRENQKMITIGRLTASIAHEINNPLASVTNLLYLISSEPRLPENARRYLEMAQGELQRVVQISRQTLSFYRETATPVRVHLSNLLDEVLVLYSRRLSEKHIEVVRQYIDQDEVTVFPGEIRQVFSNLVTNAIEATAVGGRLRLRLRKSRLWSDDEVLGLRVTVGDNGAGIDPAIRRRLGEPFFTTKGEGGTGLGLWVSQSIIKRYGGQLLMHSSTGAERHGTIFSVFLPTNMRPRMVAPSLLEGAKPLDPEASAGPGGTQKNNLPDRDVISMPDPPSENPSPRRASGND